MGILDIVAAPILKIIDKVIPDPAAKQAAQLELLRLQASQEGAQLEASLKQSLAAAEIIKTEAASTNWLASSWRPLMMLTFGTLIVARFLGWTAPGISEGEYLKLWDIIQLGIGGYTIGRSAEKIVPSIVTALRK